MIFATDHKSVGARFLWLALFCVLLGMALSLAMRLELSHRGGGLPANNAGTDAITLLHGSLMVFFVLTAAPQCGFGFFLLPLQIGARDMAFPRLSGISFWMTVSSLVGIASSVLISPEIGATIWLLGVGCFSGAMLLASLNICVTTIELRAKGMTLPRLPITVWAWLVTAILSLLIFSVLLASDALLLTDRLAGTHFFAATLPSPAALPALWQRWFWFFAQSEVYVAMLPCFGFVTHVLSIYSRKRLWNERAAVLALCAVGLFGFCIWGEHMFASGLNPYTPLVFSMLASSLGVPSLLLVICWLGTIWGGKIRLSAAMLFALGFVSLFLSGGLSGIFLARRDFPSSGANDTFVTGHFHLVMGVAAAFAILSALFFWFPKMFGRRLNETLGKIHFWATFAGVYALFMTMHWLGLLERANSPAAANLQGALRSVILVATIATVAAQILFFCNFSWSLWRGERAGSRNPWRATTLEWYVDSPPPSENFAGGSPVVFRGAYEFGVALAGEDFVPQHLTPERLAELQ
ncbi:MAG: cbb3-type cytochrome c oxidase subunit I [Acidobacteria bacterium]|nr:cbb3-type cytochrome c oxidase subunit I [Acidobacteriota bacterium]